MVLKEYFNFERNIKNKILNIKTFEFHPGEKTKFDYNIFKSFYIFFNIGHILQYEIDETNIFCPAKSGLIGIKNHPVFMFNKSHYYKFTVITLNKEIEHILIKKLESYIEDKFKHIIKSKNFSFSFSLNIEMIELIESIYKTAASLKEEIYYLELESKFLLFLSVILKEIFYENFRYNELAATPDLKYLYCLKSMSDTGLPASRVLKLYNLDEKSFERICKKFSYE
ncbi:MAG TPA: hypothetical protein PLE45_10705 [Spirochaetota bacterium]|nr:hypothetical protein [Spirochaetota bacterium]HOL57555.1 hypothetical protein [Spirochaetota bacterium]HPP05112.1 hypothetical protein [Spirochaetota bacterium]